MRKNSEACLWEKNTLYRLADLPYLELYQGYNIKRSFSRHVHFVFSLGIIVEGKRLYNFSGKSFQVKPGDIIMVNPGETHENTVSDGFCNSLAIRLEANEFQKLKNRFYGSEPSDFRFSLPVIRDEKLWRRILKLHQMLGQSGSLSAKESLLTDTFFILFNRHGITKPPRFKPSVGAAVCEIRDYLYENHAENVSLAELARITKLSPFQLVREFGNQMGVPPHTYLTQVRLNRALKLLSQGSSLAEAAQETGFYDQSHFCKAFKKKFGLTPGEYRIRSFEV